MPVFRYFPHTIITALLLLLGLLSGANLTFFQNWIPVVGLTLGFVVTCYFAGQSEKSKSNWCLGHWPWIWRLVLVAVIIAAWFSLSQIIAIFLIGCLYLGIYFLSSLNIDHENEKKLSQKFIVIICFLVAIVLISTPVSFSRVVLYLTKLSVPSKFQLHSDEDARHRHYGYRSVPRHILVPVKIQLSANNVRLDEPMPWIQLSAQRDTSFTIDRIRYDFIHFAVHELTAKALHQISLDARSDDVTFSTIDEGIFITDLGVGESAWIKLPSIDPVSITSQIKVKLAIMKLFIWFLVCLGFNFWAPGIRSNKEIEI